MNFLPGSNVMHTIRDLDEGFELGLRRKASDCHQTVAELFQSFCEEQI